MEPEWRRKMNICSKIRGQNQYQQHRSLKKQQRDHRELHLELPGELHQGQPRLHHPHLRKITMAVLTTMIMMPQTQIIALPTMILVFRTILPTTKIMKQFQFCLLMTILMTLSSDKKEILCPWLSVQVQVWMTMMWLRFVLEVILPLVLMFVLVLTFWLLAFVWLSADNVAHNDKKYKTKCRYFFMISSST
jgi:hypothetical protein